MSEWISIGDHFPEVGNMVLCSGLDYKTGPGRHYVVAQYDGYLFAMIDPEGDINVMEYITHWMPLPAPPKVD